MDAWAMIRHVFCKVFCPCEECHRKKRVTRRATYRFKNVSFTAEGDHMALNLTSDEVPGTVNVTVEFKTAGGKPAKVDGAPTWAASNPALIDTLTPSADGMSASFHITDTVDVSQLTVTADVDMGSGVKTTDFVDTVSVIAAEAVSANFAFGAVTPDP